MDLSSLSLVNLSAVTSTRGAEIHFNVHLALMHLTMALSTICTVGGVDSFDYKQSERSRSLSGEDFLTRFLPMRPQRTSVKVPERLLSVT